MSRIYLKIYFLKVLFFWGFNAVLHESMPISFSVSDVNKNQQGPVVGMNPSITLSSSDVLSSFANKVYPDQTADQTAPEELSDQGIL